MIHERLRRRHRLAVDAVASVLGQTPTTTGLHVAAAVAGAVGADRQLFLGASNPIRDVSLAGPGFINLSVTDDYLAQAMNRVADISKLAT